MLLIMVILFLLGDVGALFLSDNEFSRTLHRYREQMKQELKGKCHSFKINWGKHLALIEENKKDINYKISKQ